jgi:sugar phosphate permease
MAEQSGGAGLWQLLHTRRWLFVAPSLALWWLIGQVDKINISLVIADPSFLRELKLQGRYGELGGLMSAFLLGYGVSIFLWGFLVDRFGPRRCLIAGTIGWGVIMFLMSRSTTFEELLVARFMLGVAEGNMWPVSNALTNRWFPVREHSRAQTFCLAGASTGTMMGVPLVTALIAASNWRGMMAGLGAFSLVVIVNFSFIANRPRSQKGLNQREVEEIESDPKKTETVAQMSFQELLKSASFWLITSCMIVSVTTIFTLLQWAPSFLTAERHLSRDSMSGSLTAGYAMATVMALLVGYIGDRTMRRALTAAGMSLGFTVLVLPAALLLPPRGGAVLLAALTATPLVTAALNGALLHTLVRPEAVARGTGIYSGVGSIIPALIGPYGFGKLITALNGEYWGGFAFLAFLNLLGAGCYFALHRMSSRTAAAAALVPATQR